MFSLAWALLSMGACTPSARSEASRPIEVLVANDAETLDPRFATDPVGLRATRLAHAGLTRLDPDSLAPVPWVARGWRWLDDRTLRVELRDDVRFHSGAPVTSRDVIATLRAFATSRHARVVDAIGGADADGDGAVIVHLSRAHATLLSDLELPILRADQASGPPDPEGALDGLGPFRVARVERGAVTFEPAEHAVLPKPAHGVVLRTVHDENARALRLYAGRADVAINLFSPTLLPALAEHGDLAITSRPGSNLTYLVVRHKDALDGLDVRRAIAMSIDRAMLARTLLGGRAQPAYGVLPPSHWVHTRDAAAIPFDPRAARELLGGRAVRLTLLTSADRLRVSLARAMAQELEDVGIDVEVVSLEVGTLLARLNAGDFDLALLQLPEFSEPHLLRHFFHSKFAPPVGGNRGRISDPELDTLLDEGGSTLGLDARKKIYAEVEEIIVSRMHAVPLFHEDHVAVTSLRARTFLPSAEGRWVGLATLP